MQARGRKIARFSASLACILGFVGWGGEKRARTRDGTLSGPRSQGVRWQYPITDSLATCLPHRQRYTANPPEPPPGSVATSTPSPHLHHPSTCGEKEEEVSLLFQIMVFCALCIKQPQIRLSQNSLPSIDTINRPEKHRLIALRGQGARSNERGDFPAHGCARRSLRACS